MMNSKPDFINILPLDLCTECVFNIQMNEYQCMNEYTHIVFYPASNMVVEDDHQIKEYHMIVVISQCSAWLDSLPKA